MKVFLFLLLFPLAAMGAQKPLPCIEALTLTFGDEVPCAKGVLFPPAWALEATRLKTVKIPELENDLKFAKERLGLKIKALQMELEIEQRLAAEQNRFLDTLLKEYEPRQPRPWWESPELWVGVGFVAGAVATIAVTYAVGGGR